MEARKKDKRKAAPKQSCKITEDARLNRLVRQLRKVRDLAEDLGQPWYFTSLSCYTDSNLQRLESLRAGNKHETTGLAPDEPAEGFRLAEFYNLCFQAIDILYEQAEMGSQKAFEALHRQAIVMMELACQSDEKVCQRL